MSGAIVYLKAELMANEGIKQNLESHCGLLATAHGYKVDQVVVEDSHDSVPYTLDEVLRLHPSALIVPAFAHIDHRARRVLNRCALVVGRPYGYYQFGYYGFISGLQPSPLP